MLIQIISVKCIPDVKVINIFNTFMCNNDNVFLNI